MQSVLFIVGLGVAAYFVVTFLFKRDTAQENRRLESIELSDICAKNGLPILSKFLRRYAVGDYSGMAFAAREIRDVLSNPEEMEDVVNRFLKLQLGKKLETVEGREQIVAEIEKRLGVEIPVEVIQGLAKKKLVTEDQATEDVEKAVDEVLDSIPPANQQG
jgi:hypothetical protein